MSATVYAETSWRIFRFSTHPEDTPTGTCDVCDGLDGVEVEERLIGGAFPNAEQIDEDSYDARVHGKCACTLDLVEDNQAQDSEASSDKPSTFTYWRERETKHENIETTEASATPSKFAYWKNAPEQKEAEFRDQGPKTETAIPKQVEKVKPLSKPKSDNAPGKPAQKTAQPVPFENLSINKQTLPKLYSSPGEKKEKPLVETPISEEINPSEPKIIEETEVVPQPEPETESTFAYWPTQPEIPTSEPSSEPEPTVNQLPWSSVSPVQQPLELPEFGKPLVASVPSQPKPKPVVKAPVQYFSYWAQGHMPNAETEKQFLQTSPERENATQYGYYAQPTLNAEDFEETFAESKVSDEVAEKVAPKVAQKVAKLAYWNPVGAEDSAEDNNELEEGAEEETSEGEESSLPGMPLRLSPRRVFRAFKNVQNLERIGLRSLASAGGINPATAAVASMLVPLISELVRVEVELQLREHNKKMEQERNSQYRAAYASVTPL